MHDWRLLTPRGGKVTRLKPRWIQKDPQVGTQEPQVRAKDTQTTAKKEWTKPLIRQISLYGAREASKGMPTGTQMQQK